MSFIPPCPVDQQPCFSCGKECAKRRTPRTTHYIIRSPRPLTFEQIMLIQDVWTVCDDSADRFRQLIDALGGDMKLEEFPGTTVQG